MFAEAQKEQWGTAFGEPSEPAVAPSDAINCTIKKSDDELQIVYGEVYAPTIPDSQGDFMTRETIREMAHNFLRKGLVQNIDIQHTREQSGAYVVESFVAREDDPTFIPGSWVLGVKIPDPEVWALVKSGELNGFSMDGEGVRRAMTYEFEVPPVIEGMTEETDGHRHRFAVQYDEHGNFLGGVTDKAPDGHYHRIRAGTVTDEAQGHSHRFSFLEAIHA